MESPTRVLPLDGFHRISELLKCKWTLAILDAIARGVTRPSQVQRALPGLTAKVLNDRVAKLERYGIIEREVFPEVPPHVEYRLTSTGARLVGLLEQIRQFVDEEWSSGP